MNKYQTIYLDLDDKKSIDEKEIVSAIDNISSWEDAYWLSKILITGIYDISDEKIIDLLEYCFFMGLSVSNKEIFFDANECLAKLYIRYGMYSEASSKLMVLAYNYEECPDWVHIYLATTQLYTTFERIVEEPKFFFQRLLKVDIDKIESRNEVQSVFKKYLCLIVENDTSQLIIAKTEIVEFAEKVRVTASDEFRLFHQAVCPDVSYQIFSDDSKELLEAKHLAQKAIEEAEATKKEAEKLRKKVEESKQAELEAINIARLASEKAKRLHREAAISKEAEKTANLDAEKSHAEIERLKNSELQARSKVDQLVNEKTELEKRLQEFKKLKQTGLEPQNIDDIFLKISGWLNVSLRRYLAQWLTGKLSKTCKNDFWNKKVKNSLQYKELEKFDNYRELTDFAIDALLNIYYNNLGDFHTFSSMAKTNDKDRIHEMQQIRNRWVGHFEENSWTKEKILFDLDTIIGFIDQIEMPREKQAEYIEFRDFVSRMS